jgi:type IV pilus biogenesis protein CpaD/CtpE
MKKIILAMAAVTGLLVGCASQDQNRGGSSDEYYNNATHGTGSSTATNQNSGADSSMSQ